MLDHRSFRIVLIQWQYVWSLVFLASKHVAGSPLTTCPVLQALDTTLVHSPPPTPSHTPTPTHELGGYLEN